VVVRLKGGDPFVFGRGGEEVEALAEAGIPFEVVPGVSSAVAVPAYAGIPLTYRKLASSFAVITGHEGNEKETPALDWEKLTTAVDTLVILMGVKNLPRIVTQLLAHGRSTETPVALIRWGTTDNQQTITGTLGDIVGKAQAARLEPPVVTVIGEVVTLRGHLQWFHELAECSVKAPVMSEASQLLTL
jgi:uroporphyrinogen III methyltransferase/synthase